jgi:hypothetical protein
MSQLPPRSFFAEVEGKLRGLLIELEPQLLAPMVEAIDSLIEATEPGVALEVLADELTAGGGVVTRSQVRIMDDLASRMKMDLTQFDGLRANAIDDDPSI